MSTTIYDTGDAVRLGNHSGDAARTPFADAAGTATDPTAVTLTVKKPDATLLVYGWPSAGASGTLTKEATGRFYHDVTFSADGFWRCRLAGTGAVETAVEWVVWVRPSAVV